MAPFYTRRNAYKARQGKARSVIPSAPSFITSRPTIYYNHLPRHTVSSDQDGTLSDRIGWVLLHKDLIGHVEARLRNIPNAITNVQAYRALARAAPSYGILKGYLPRTSAPRCEKTRAVQVADEAYQAIIEGADNIISTLSTPEVAHALSDLLPLRRQHGSITYVDVLLHPSRIDDYPQPEWKHTELSED